jgi:hypothetical protein
MAKNAISVTIAAGQSISAAADLTSTAAATVVLVPPGLDADPNGRLNLSFLISDDNVTFYDVFDAQGSELLRTIIPGCAVNIDPSLTSSAMYLKIRSGPRDGPVIQTADRVFKLITS